ncbi:MAG TPA: potassium-transporting ATPase subunit KdpC [Steroidobacteraceae bacterium]|nr:potassium-transporting ATPase subunit KdpC [Steroidobacteraceae bacterium]
MVSPTGGGDRAREGIGREDGSSAAEARFAQQVRPAVLSVLVLTLVAGGVFPLLLFAIGVPFFPSQSAGSLIRLHGTIVGSSLIGQDFTRPEWFQPRPSAAGRGYDGTASGGTNLAPDNPTLREGGADFVGIRALAAAYRRRNGLASDTAIPIDAVTRSGSGLDPDITPANASLQVARVARLRSLAQSDVRRLVQEHVVQPQFGFLGEPRVSVLELNLALLRLQPRASPAPHAAP